MHNKINIRKRNNDKITIRQVISFFLILIFGVFIGRLFDKNNDFEENNNDYKKLNEVITLINHSYVDEVNTSMLVEDAIKSILEKLDPHSSYISVEDKVSVNESLQGNFEGIGVEFNIFRDTIVVVRTLSGGPSELVGILSEDKIIKIDDKIVAGVGFRNIDVMKHLKGSKGSKVKVSVQRGRKKNVIDFDIIRDKIPQSSVVATYMLDSETGYIKIANFSVTTYDEFIVALSGLLDMGLKRLILDLQGNGGGYMHHAVNIADEFLKDGQKIVYTKGKDKTFNSDYNSNRKGVFEEGELMVLINENSASASEIVAGALQDNDRALIVGRRSFGKGLVQTPVDLADGSELRLTISRYYTPSGRSIQKPYSDTEQYSHEIMTRYDKGEFFSADSIQFDDSLKFKTNYGRTVYGGGGIMPDYFVPLDTISSFSYLNQLYVNNLIQEYVFQYVVDNKNKLDQMGYKEFFKNFEVDKLMRNELVKFGERNGVLPDRENLKKHQNLLDIHLKSLIARRIWDNDGFYPIYNKTNEVLQYAIKLLDEHKSVDDLILK